MTTPTFAKTHNLNEFLAKLAESEGFEQIIDFLNGSSVKYALTASPTIRTSCIKQFWSTTKVKTVNDEVRVQALIDAKRVNIKESSIRHTLKLDDEEGTSCLANDEIFTGLANMGYDNALVLKPPPEMNLAALWHQQSSVLLQTRSLTSQVSSVDHQLGNMSHHQDIYDNPSLSKKVFANMKRVGTGFSGVITSLFENMLVPAIEEVAPKVPSLEPLPEHLLPSPSNDLIPDANKDSLKFQELIDLCIRFSNKVLDLKSEVIDIKFSFTDKIAKLEDRVHKLEEENMILKEKSFKSAKIDTAAPVDDKEESFKHGRMIADMDADVEVNLEEAQAKAYNLDLQHSEKVLNMQDNNEEEHAEVKEVLEVVTAAKLIIEVANIVAPITVAQVPNANAPRRRMGVVIQEPEEIAASVIVHIEVQPKDKGKGILIEEPKPLKRQAQIEQDEAFARQLEAKLNANIN
nr:hypothetical protein [Tanacetum cinerariifolium]